MRASLLCFILAASLSSRADVLSWTNLSGGTWGVPANWSPNQVPTTNDIAIITNSGSYTVTLGGSPVVAGFLLGGPGGTQTLATAGQTLTLNGAGRVGVNGVLSLDGTLSGTNQVNLAGRLTWWAGSIDYGAGVMLETNGQIIIGGGANYTRVLLGTLTNTGTIVYQPPGPLVVAGPLHNLPGGLVDIQWNSSLFKGGPEGLVVNEGTFRKSAGTTTFGCEVPLFNYGTVDTQTGKVTLSDGSRFHDGCRFIGSGQTLLSGGTNTLEGRLYTENLYLVDASLTGTGTVSGTLTWSAGCIDYGAGVRLETNSQLIIGGGANYTRVLRGSLTNAGTIVYQPPGPLVVAGPLHNLPGGLVDIQWNSSLFKGGPEGLVVNEGTFRKSAGTATFGCEVPLFNYGTVDTQTGKVTLSDGSRFHDGCRFIGSGQTLLSGGTNTLEGRLYTENLYLVDASLTGTGTISGTLTWSAGYIDYGAGVRLETNSQLIIGGGANFARVLRGSLTNAGTIVYQPPGPLGIAGRLHNLPGGLVDIQWDNSLFKGGPEGVVVNEGIFRKSAGGATSGCEVPLLNCGVVDTQTGQVTLSDGCRFEDGCRFTGSGLTLLNGGTNTLEGRLYSENLYLADASLTGTGTVSGTLTWLAGYIDYGAGLLLQSNSQLIIGGGANFARVLRGSLTNAGTIIYKPPGPLLIGGRLHNLPGGLVDIQWDNSLFKGGPEGVVVNEGIFRKSVGGGASGCEVPIYNRGIVQIPTGTLYFIGLYVDECGVLALAGGNLRADTPLNLTGGRLTGWGAVLADVVNHTGAVCPAGSNGVLTIYGNYTQRLTGFAEFILGGLSPGTNHGQLVISQKAQLNGTISVRRANSYIPNPGDSFQVMKFGSRAGKFASENGFFVRGHARRLTAVYGRSTLDLITVEAPEPELAALQIGAEGTAALVSWPAEFPGGSLYYCTNLANPAWTLIPGVTNRYLDSPMVPEKFFGLFSP